MNTRQPLSTPNSSIFSDSSSARHISTSEIAADGDDDDDGDDVAPRDCCSDVDDVEDDDDVAACGCSIQQAISTSVDANVNIDRSGCIATLRRKYVRNAFSTQLMQVRYVEDVMMVSQ